MKLKRKLLYFVADFDFAYQRKGGKWVQGQGVFDTHTCRTKYQALRSVDQLLDLGRTPVLSKINYLKGTRSVCYYTQKSRMIL